MAQWEYFTLKLSQPWRVLRGPKEWGFHFADAEYTGEDRITECLNHLCGRNGWELVSVLPITDSKGGMSKALMFFKRLKE